VIQFKRQSQILKIIKERKFVSIKELSKQLYFSEATIRRDLHKLEKRGLIECVRGGAVIKNYQNIETPFHVRKIENLTKKQIIAKKAADMIENNDILFLDASSTVLQLVQHLDKFKNLTVVTNGLHTAMAISGFSEIKVYCSGGMLREINGSSLVGSQARSFFSNISANKMFFSVRSVHPVFGLSDTMEEEAEVKQVMMEHANKIILLADSTKLNTSSFYHVAGLQDIDTFIIDETDILKGNEWKSIHSKVIFATQEES